MDQIDSFYKKETSKEALKACKEICFIKSPSLFLAESITLPYEYSSLSTDTFQNSDDIFSSISEIQVSSLKNYHNLKTNVQTWSKKLEQWEKLAEEKHLFQAKKLAPGYLDTKQRLLMPISIKHPSTIS
ncbi:hypothetical protein PMAC_002694 [Pneumocystis sp. 'macacae']|nr:hypothetical protein PMAC_002694 [Pneumocystis sp. 'macacae']